MVHTERCRKRMEAAMATTEDGRRRLAQTQERIDAWLAKEIERADARPEGETKGDVPSVPPSKIASRSPTTSSVTLPLEYARESRRPNATKSSTRLRRIS